MPGSLTQTERSDTRKFLGWPMRFYQLRPELEMAMEALNMGTEEDRTIVRAALAGCNDIDTRLLDALLRNKASEVGSIKLNPREIGNLRSEGRRHVGRLSSALRVRILSDAFSGAGGLHRTGFYTE